MGADSSTSARIIALGGAISVSSGDASEVSSCWRPPELSLRSWHAAYSP